MATPTDRGSQGSGDPARAFEIAAQCLEALAASAAHAGERVIGEAEALERRGYGSRESSRVRMLAGRIGGLGAEAARLARSVRESDLQAGPVAPTPDPGPKLGDFVPETPREVASEPPTTRSEPEAPHAPAPASSAPSQAPGPADPEQATRAAAAEHPRMPDPEPHQAPSRAAPAARPPVPEVPNQQRHEPPRQPAYEDARRPYETPHEPAAVTPEATPAQAPAPGAPSPSAGEQTHAVAASTPSGPPPTSIAEAPEAPERPRSHQTAPPVDLRDQSPARELEANLAAPGPATPGPHADSPAPAAPAPPAAPEQSAPQAIAPAPGPATESQPAHPGAAAPGAVKEGSPQAVRVLALQMAGTGGSREQVEQRLAAEFGISAPAGVLDEVFGSR